MSTRTFSISPQGPFALRESATFGFGQRMRPAGVGGRGGDSASDFDGVMRLAFCLDGSYARQVGVEVRQDGDDVRCVVHGAGELAAIKAQTTRVLSLDHDARGFVAVGKRDPVIARLLQAAPGLRPPLFYSPYEAAVWAILSARRQSWQMDRVRSELARAHGRVFQLGGVELAALPTPNQLLAVESFESIEPLRLERMKSMARAAADGLLDAATLRAADPAEAAAALQQLPGIGPFYASLILIRGTGVTDILPANEPRALALAGELYGLGHPASAEEFASIALAWSPWRTWCTVLLRAAGGRLA